MIKFKEVKRYTKGLSTVQNIPILLPGCYNLRKFSSTAVVSPAGDLTTNEAESISCILGPSGLGKTALLQTELVKWTAKAEDERLCLYFDMRRLCKNLSRRAADDSTSGYREMFRNSSLYCDMESELLERTIDTMIKTNGKGVVILLDHFDALNTMQLKQSMLFKLLRRESLPQATVIVAGPATILKHLTVTCESPCQTYILDGIKSGSESQLLKLMKVRFKAERVAEYVQYHCLELCRIPGMLATLLSQLREKPPKTFSDIGESLVISLINDWTSSSIFSPTCKKTQPPSCDKIQSLSTLPQDKSDKLALVSELAYHSLVSDSDHYYCEIDIRKFMTLKMQDGEIADFSLGLLLCKTVALDNEVANLQYQFAPVVLEYLAAYYMASLPVLNQISLFRRNASKFLCDGKNTNFCKFYFGMPHLLSKLQTTSKNLTLSTIALKPLLETVVISQLYDDEEQTVKSQKLKLVLQLLHESQDKNLVSKFLNRREKYLDLTLRLSAIPEPLVSTLAFVIAHSGISKWSIQVSENIKYSAEFISDLVRKESSKKVVVHVYTDASSTDFFRVVAHGHGSTQAKTFSPMTAHARCMREVLHRLLQLYSPIKLRSNSTEPSFVSFLVCACLKDKLEKEQMLIIEPIHAIHWVSVKMKKEKPAGSKVTADEKNLYDHMAQHGMEQLELVLMMSPLPNRIRYRDPLDKNKMETIELYKGEDSHFLDGRIAASLQDHLRGNETISSSVAMETRMERSPSDMCVVSPFLIPPCFKEIMAHIVMDPNIAETYTYRPPVLEDPPEDSRDQQQALSAQGNNRVETDGQEAGAQGGVRVEAVVETDLRERSWMLNTRVETDGLETGAQGTRVEADGLETGVQGTGVETGRRETLGGVHKLNTRLQTESSEQGAVCAHVTNEPLLAMSSRVQSDQQEMLVVQDRVQPQQPQDIEAQQDLINIYSQEDSEHSGRNGNVTHKREEFLPMLGVGSIVGTVGDNPVNFTHQESVRPSVQLSQQVAQQSLVPLGSYASTQNRDRLVQPYFYTNLQPVDQQQPSQLETALSPKQSIQPSVQQSLTTNVQRQVAAPPGTVLHSADPSVFTVDSVYSLPKENMLIKKGGNGSVFSVRYSGKEYAVKKTAFRNREFLIHKKLKHANIIQLTCFMFGTQQPHQRRRYFCYHFMPCVTGDLARMVTDKPHLTMRSLSSKYENDPRKLGCMRGNWKYVLKELLKGLGYMHSLGVVHRDMKASNVLIKMHCSCDNPLTCVCSQKCSVKISDFDAALQLDESSGLLQPSSAKVPGQQGVYQVTPVGTDGYRSPESSQLTLSNHLSIINPPLTVKSDIWSVGLILLRILNGANGPTSQKKLSTLLLYYEQEKQAQRKPHIPRFMQITKSQVEEIIGLHYFSEVSSSWISQAVECIAKCVEVDPEKRPSAKELLKDPFLY